MIEKWKDIPGFELAYQVSNKGRIRSKSRIGSCITRKPKDVVGKILKTPIHVRGYSLISMQFGNRKITKSVHRLVADAFIPNPDNLPMINHINGIKTDNRIENLEWMTAKENTNHAISIGIKIGRPGRKVEMIDSIGNVLKSYDSLKSVLDDGFNNYYVLLVCKGKSKSYKNHYFRYAT